MLPGVGPLSVRQGIANGVVGDGNAIVSRQQVAPGAVAVGAAYGVRSGAEGPRSVGILGPGENVARVIISPDMGESARMVVTWPVVTEDGP